MPTVFLRASHSELPHSSYPHLSLSFSLSFTCLYLRDWSSSSWERKTTLARALVLILIPSTVRAVFTATVLCGCLCVFMDFHSSRLNRARRTPDLLYHAEPGLSLLVGLRERQPISPDHPSPELTMSMTCSGTTLRREYSSCYLSLYPIAFKPGSG